MKVVLITGATGTFGHYLLAHLLKRSDLRIVALVRASSQNAAYSRMEHLGMLRERIEILKADLTHQDLGLEETDAERLSNSVTHILHAAASTRFTSSIDDLRVQNVRTTENIVDFAQKCKTLERFVHLSSAAVAGKRTGLVTEDDFDAAFGFNNAYEQSKFEAELCVRNTSDSIHAVVVRPPLVFTKPPHGYKGPTNSLAHGLRLAQQGRLPLFPGNPESRFDIVDGDIVASLIVELLLKSALKYKSYHLTNAERALTVGQMLKILEKVWETEIPVEFCGAEREFQRRVWWRTLFRPRMRLTYKKASSYLIWFAHSKVFDNSHLLEEVGLSALPPDPRARIT